MWDHGETGIPVAGPGAPLVAEFSVTEFAAAIGLPTEAGKAYLGEAVELRYRLPRVWARVVKGDLPAWRARRIARATIILSVEGAAYVDFHVAHTAHRVGPAQVDRLVEEAIGRFMPEEAERRRRQAADGRSFTIDTRQPSLTGTSAVYGELDLADALDLDAAVAAGAQALKDLGSTESLDVRRATAVGDLARRQLTLDLNTATPGGPADGDVATGEDRRHRPAPTAPDEEDPQAASGGALRAPLRRRRGPRRPVGRGVRAGGEHQGSGARRTDPAVVRQPRRRDHRATGARPERAHRRRGLRDPRPTPGTDHPGPPDLCVPLVHPTRPGPGARRARRGLRPPGPLRPGEAQLLLQPSPRCAGAITGPRPTAAGPTPPWNAGRMCGPARTGTSTCATTTAPSTSPATGTPTRRTPAPTARPTALNPRTPRARPPDDSTPPPRTPPDHHRRGHRHVQGRSGHGHEAGVQPSRHGAPGLDKLDQRLPRHHPVSLNSSACGASTGST